MLRRCSAYDAAAAAEVVAAAQQQKRLAFLQRATPVLQQWVKWLLNTQRYSHSAAAAAAAAAAAVQNSESPEVCASSAAASSYSMQHTSSESLHQCSLLMLTTSKLTTQAMSPTGEATYGSTSTI
jgi:hypothetical protein